MYIYTYIIYILYDIWGGNRDDENPIIPAALPGTSVGNMYKKSCQSQVIGDSQWPQITLWLCQNSYWKWPFIVDFPIENGGSFHSFLYVDQRVPEGTSYSWNRVAAIPWFHVMLKFRRWVKRWLTGDENTAYFVSIQIFIYQQPFVSCIYIYHGCIFTYRHITLHIQIYRHWIVYIIIIYIYNYLYIYIYIYKVIYVYNRFLYVVLYLTYIYIYGQIIIIGMIPLINHHFSEVVVRSL